MEPKSTSVHRVVDSFCWTLGIDFFFLPVFLLGPGFLLPDSLEPQHRKAKLQDVMEKMHIGVKSDGLSMKIP